MKYFFLIFLISICFSCSQSKYSESRYQDNVITKSVKTKNSYTRNFERHGLTYFDTIYNKRLIGRTVYQENKLQYRYPIEQSKLGKTYITLKSGKNYLTQGVDDTLIVTNKYLPILNIIRTIDGAYQSWLSDTSLIVRTKNTTSKKAVFYLSAHTDYEEIRTENRLIVDSLVMEIK